MDQSRPSLPGRTFSHFSLSRNWGLGTRYAAGEPTLFLLRPGGVNSIQGALEFLSGQGLVGRKEPFVLAPHPLFLPPWRVREVGCTFWGDGLCALAGSTGMRRCYWLKRSCKSILVWTIHNDLSTLDLVSPFNPSLLSTQWPSPRPVSLWLVFSPLPPCIDRPKWCLFLLLVWLGFGNTFSFLFLVHKMVHFACLSVLLVC